MFLSTDVPLSFDLIKPGLTWNFLRLSTEKGYQDLYNGNLSLLWRKEPSEFNGLKFLKGYTTDILKINWFARVTDFYTHALFSEPPTNLPAYIVPELEHSTRSASIKGRGVLVAEENLIYSVDASNYFPVMDYTGTTEIGSILAYPYSKAFDRITNPVHTHIDLTLVPKGEPSVRRTYKFDGSTLGELENEVPSSVLGIVTYGGGVSDYRDLIDLVREYLIRLTLNSRTLNKHAMPHMTGPESEEESFNYRANGMYLGSSDSDKDFKYITWDPQNSAVIAQIATLLNEINSTTGIPPSVFGITNQTQESAIAKERHYVAVLNRVRQTRRDIMRALRQIASAAGLDFPTVEWLSDPFSDYPERVGAEVALVNAKISEVEDARDRLFRGVRENV